jgi:TonB family protein
MRMSHYVGASVLVFSLLYLSFPISGSQTVRAQQQPDASANQDTASAIQLYKRGDTIQAIKLLRVIVDKQPDDADAWYYLGLAFNSEGIFGSARPAFEELIKLRPDSADAHAKLAFALSLANEPQKAIAIAQRALELGDQSAEAHYAIGEASLRTGAFTKAVEEADTTLKINPNFTLALITKSFAHFNLRQYPEAATSLERFLASSPDDLDAETWRGQLEGLRRSTTQTPTTKPATDTPAAVSSTDYQRVFSGKDVTQKARLLSKPEPQYTEAARKAGVIGTVVVRAVFASDGEVTRLVVLRPLGYGLTTQAIKVARQIKFDPAMKDAKPVSMWMQLEYRFTLY